MALMNLVSAWQLPDIIVTAEDFAQIILAIISATVVDLSELPEWSNAMEALCRSHSAQQFGVQRLQALLSSEDYSDNSIEHCLIWTYYLTIVYQGVLMCCFLHIILPAHLHSLVSAVWTVF